MLVRRRIISVESLFNRDKKFERIVRSVSGEHLSPVALYRELITQSASVQYLLLPTLKVTVGVCHIDSVRRIHPRSRLVSIVDPVLWV